MPVAPSSDPSRALRDAALISYVNTAVVSSLDYKGGYDANANTPDLDTAPSGVLKGDFYTVTVAGTFFTTAVEIGDVVIAEADDASTEAAWTMVQANLTPASIKTQYESNANTNAYTDAEVAEVAVNTAKDTCDETNLLAVAAALSAPLALNGQAITGVGLVDGVDIATDVAANTAKDTCDDANVLAVLAALSGAADFNGQALQNVGLVDGVDIATDVGANTAKDTCDATNVNAAGAVMETDEVTPISYTRLAADDQLTGDGMGATTETAYDAISVTAVELGTARRRISFMALLHCDSQNGGDTWTINVRLGGVAGTLVLATAAAASAAGDLIVLRGEIVIRTTGGGGTFHAVSSYQWETGAAAGGTYVTSGAVDTTGARDLVVTCESSSNNVGQQMSLVHFESAVFPA